MLNGIAFSGAKELFPLDKLKINMSVAEFKQAYPNAKLGMLEKDDTGTIVTGFAVQQIIDNQFWSSSLISINSEQISSCSYLGKNDNYDLFKERAMDTYQQLIQHFDIEPEKKIARSDIPELAQFNKKMPVYLWKENGLIYAFTHSSFEEHQEGEKFRYGLRITKPEMVSTLLVNLSGYNKEEKVLFEGLSDITIDFGKNTKLWYGFVVIAILGTLLVLAVFIYTRKRKTGN
jgi:hypothetical protein